MRFAPVKRWRQPVYLLVGAVVAIAGGLWAWHALGQSGSGTARVATASAARPAIPADSVTPAPAQATTAAIDEPSADGPLPPVEPGVAQGQGARAREEYRQGLKCLQYARLTTRLDQIKDLVEHPEHWPNRDPNALLAEMEKELAYIENNDAQCRGRESLLTDGSMYEITLRAALAGDRDAMDCYALAPFEIPESLDIDTIAAGKFRRHAVAFIESGIRAGDWKAVLLNQIRHDPANATLPFSQTGSLWFKQFKREDTATACTYLRLRQLGAQAVGAPDLQYLQLLASDYQQPLTPAQIASAEKRAAELYGRYFIGAADYPGKGGFCNF